MRSTSTSSAPPFRSVTTMRSPRACSASVTQPARSVTASDAPAGELGGGRVQRRALGQRVGGDRAPVGLAARARPRRRACRAPRGRTRRAGRRRSAPSARRRSAGSSVPAQPRARRASQRAGSEALDAVLERALVDRVDAAVAEPVGVAVRAGRVDDDVGVDDRLAAVGPRRRAGETGAPRARGSPIASCLSSPSRPTASTRVPQADAAGELRQRGDRLEQLVGELRRRSAAPCAVGRVRAARRASAARRSSTTA